MIAASMWSGTGSADSTPPPHRRRQVLHHPGRGSHQLSDRRLSEIPGRRDRAAVSTGSRFCRQALGLGGHSAIRRRRCAVLQHASTKHTCLPRRETGHSSCCKCTVPAAAADCGPDGLGDVVLEHYSVLVREAHWGTSERHPPTARAALFCHSIFFPLQPWSSCKLSVCRRGLMHDHATQVDRTYQGRRQDGADGSV